MAEPFDLVRDVLDKLVRDSNDRECGRVDGVILHLRHGRPPRVGEIHIGVTTMLHRVHHRLGDWLAGVMTTVSPVPLDPIAIPLEDCEISKRCLTLAIDAERDRRFMRVEKWLRSHVVGKIPGGSTEKASK